jgi:hypothetical protein
VDDAWEQLRYANGDTITEAHGIFFINGDTGQVEGWKARQAEADYRAGPQAVHANAYAVQTEYLLDRLAGLAYRWSNSDLRLIGIGERYLAFQLDRGAMVSSPGRTIAIALLSTEGIRETFRFELATRDTPHWFHHVQVDDVYERALIVAPYGNGQGFVFHHIRLPWGPMNSWQGEWAKDGFQTYIRDVEAWLFDNWIAVHLEFVPPEFGPGQFRTVKIIDWDGNVVPGYEFPEFPGYGGIELAPGPGEHYLVQSYYRATFEEGPSESWPEVTVYRTGSNEPLFRVRSATLYGFDLSASTHWSAAWDSFAAHTLSQDNTLPYPARLQGEIFSIEPRHGDPSSWLVPAVAFDPEASWKEGPGLAPSPQRDALIGLNRTTVFNSSTDEVFGVHVPGGAGHSDPWSAGPDEMVFTVPHHGHGGGGPSALLPAVIEEPPFDGVLRFRVDGAGECLNLRVRPALSSPVRACIADGALLTLIEPTFPAPGEADGTGTDQPGEGLAFHYNWNDELAFVHITTPSGATGWVAIQYLDWAP